MRQADFGLICLPEADCREILINLTIVILLWMIELNICAHMDNLKKQSVQTAKENGNIGLM